jgi:hypothetical protein
MNFVLEPDLEGERHFVCPEIWSVPSTEQLLVKSAALSNLFPKIRLL